MGQTNGLKGAKENYSPRGGLKRKILVRYLIYFNKHICVFTIYMLCWIFKTIWKILLKITKYNITFCLPPVTIGSDGQIIDAF